MPIIPVTPIYLVDTSGQQWQLSCGNGGAPIQTTPVSGVTAFASILLSDISFNQAWRLVIVPNPSTYPGASPGDIHIDPVDGTASSRQIAVNSPDGNMWWIRLSNGLLVTAVGGVCTPPVGSLYIPNWNNIPWNQPGGVGTKVFPTQNDGPFAAYPVPGQWISEAGEALWRAGCGHGFDCAQIFRDYDDCTGQSAAIQCCPICTYIIRSYEPYEVIFSQQFPILVS